MTDKISIIVPIPPKERMGERKVEILESINRQKHKCIPVLIEGGTASENRNKGIERAKTEYVAFANMHSILSDDWSEKVLDFFDKHPEIDIVGGPHLTPKEETIFGRLSGYALGSIFGAAGSSARYNIKKEMLDADERHLTSANLICRSKVTKKVKFNEDLYPGEDPNFIKESIKKGFKVSYSPDIIVYQRRRPSWKGFAKQIFFYASARPKKESFTETLKMPAFLVPSFFVIYLVLLPYLFGINWLFVLPLGCYVVLSFCFSAYESLKNKDPLAIFFLPFLFLTIHLSYGVGFLYGVATKLIRN